MAWARTLFKLLTPPLERLIQLIDRLFSGFIQPRRLKGKLILQSYVGWGTPDHVELSGRVLLPRTISPAQQTDPRLRNMSNILRRLFSREVGGVQVQGWLAGQEATATSDLDGYFTLVFKPDHPLQSGWQAVRLTMQGRLHESWAQAQVVDQAKFGVISDLDDTVIQSDVTSLPRMLRTVLTGNAHTRLPFAGVGALYRALHRDGETTNPIFYVSSSPWNFFDLLWQFLSYRRIPLGPLFLRNWGTDLLTGHGQYKHRVIERILKQFPQLNFILVGDSAERDPEIYAEVVRRFPGRILAVYIRDVSVAGHDQNVLKLRQELRQTGVHLVLAQDSQAAASHALAMGFITPLEYRNVLISLAEDGVQSGPESLATE